MIVGVGIDIVHIPRIQRILFPYLSSSLAVKRPPIRQSASRFLRRILTTVELDDLRTRYPSASPLALASGDESPNLNDADAPSIARWVGGENETYVR